MMPSITTYHTCATAWMSSLMHECHAHLDGYSLCAPTVGLRILDPEATAEPMTVTMSWEFSQDDSERVVRVIRNPLALLAGAHFSYFHSQPVESWPLLAVQHLRLQNSAFEAEGGEREIYCLNDDVRLATIRFEDLLQAPASAFTEIFAHFGDEMPAEFAAQLAQRPIRTLPIERSFSRFSETYSNSDVGNPFAWMYRISYDAAETIYLRHRELLDRHYPEVAQFFQGVGGAITQRLDTASPQAFGIRKAA